MGARSQLSCYSGGRDKSPSCTRKGRTWLPEPGYSVCSSSCYFEFTGYGFLHLHTWHSILSRREMWQKHPNYMVYVHLSLFLRPLTTIHESQITQVVCWVSSENPESSTFYNSYRINIELPQHYTIGYKNDLHQNAEDY